jgi:hypothetical protein
VTAATADAALLSNAARPAALRRRFRPDLTIEGSHEGRDRHGAACHLAALPRAFDVQAAGPRRTPGRGVASVFIATDFAQEDSEAAKAQRQTVADQLCPKVPKLAAFMDEAKADLLAYMNFAAEHRTKLHSTNPLERLNREVKRRTDVVGSFPNEEAMIRLVGAIPLKQNDGSAVQRTRYLTLETIAPLSDSPIVSLPAVAA